VRDEIQVNNTRTLEVAGGAAPVQVYSVPLLQAIAAVPEDTLAGNLHRLQAAEFLYETYGVCAQAIDLRLPTWSES
jgi:hypothetical protein